jgi:nicotinamidase-related amidase
MIMPPPRFYAVSDLDRVYLERGALVAEEAEAYRARHGIAPSSADRVRVAAFGIDCQLGFCHPEASLYVPGAVDDMRRTLGWLYRHLDVLTGLHFSMDTHRAFQIFHPAWWVDGSGGHPEPFSVIRHEDVRSGRWMAVAHPKASLEYCRKLESTGRYVLTIWPYHTLLGGVSHALVPALMEAALFHSLVRRHQTHFETKGTHALTENYSVLSPEVEALEGRVIGGFNAAFFDLLMTYDRVYIFGQAKSHCVLSTLRDLRERIATVDPCLAQKVFVLEDAMSPVPAPPLDPLPPELNFPVVAERAFAELKQAGMNIVKTTDPLDLG